MSPRIRRRFTEDFKNSAIALVTEQGQSVSRVAADLDLVDSALRRWIAVARGVSSPPGGTPRTPDRGTVAMTPEQTELQQLRRENQILRMERDILKKATAFFAKEST